MPPAPGSAGCGPSRWGGRPDDRQRAPGHRSWRYSDPQPRTPRVEPVGSTHETAVQRAEAAATKPVNVVWHNVFRGTAVTPVTEVGDLHGPNNDSASDVRITERRSHLEIVPAGGPHPQGGHLLPSRWTAGKAVSTEPDGFVG